ncbi:hypothetical protein CL621_02505 [archaeon]|nr:hypothetical protein [archaeon]|tara:strand:- start:4508 stop:5083 length:576 start_codon:yes stop_codon:yes gene_type:complete
MSDLNHIENVVTDFGLLGEECLKIRAICEDSGYGWEKATVQYEIHEIAKNNEFEVQEFLEKNKEMRLEALDIRTGKEELKEKLKEEAINEQSDDLGIRVGKSDAARYYDFAKKIIIEDQYREADEYLKTHEGISEFFKTQSERSRRLYSDENFRTMEIMFYFGIVLPKLRKYTLKMVGDSFKRSRKKQNDI